MITGSIVGLAGGVLQDVISYFKEKKHKDAELKEWKSKMEYKFEIEKQRHELGISERSFELDIQKEHTMQIMAEGEVEKAKNEGLWFNAITKATGFITSGGVLAAVANFITATTRPIISYLFLLFIFFIYKTQMQNSPDWLATFTETVLLQMEFITSFWFYRRGSDRVSSFVSYAKKR